MYEVIQYRNGNFDSVLSGMGKNRGTLDSAHSFKSAHYHKKLLESEPWRKLAGLSYKVEKST